MISFLSLADCDTESYFFFIFIVIYSCLHGIEFNMMFFIKVYNELLTSFPIPVLSVLQLVPSFLETVSLRLHHTCSSGALGIHQKDCKVTSRETLLCMPMLPQHCSQRPRSGIGLGLSTDDWVKNMCYIYTMEFYSARRKDEILSFKKMVQIRDPLSKSS